MKNLRNLSWQKLQEALYAGHALYDKQETRKQGTAQIRAVYAEYARRGVTQIVKPRMLA